MRRVAVVAVVAAASALGVARADEPNPTKTEIEALEKQLADLEPAIGALKRGDAKTANDLLKKLGDVTKGLLHNKGKALPEWTAAMKHGAALDDRVREAATGKKPDPATPDDPTKKAVAGLDEVEKAHATQAGGDAATADRLVKQINETRTLLGKASATARKSDAWIDSAARADVLDAKVRARLAEQPGAKPDAPKPDAPRPDAPRPDAPRPDPAKPGALAAGDRPPAADKKLGSSDEIALRRDFYPLLDAIAKHLAAPDDLGDDDVARGFKAQVAKLETIASNLRDKTHPHVVWAQERVAKAKEAVEPAIQAGKKALADRRAAAPATDFAKLKAGDRPPKADRALSANDSWALRRDFYPRLDDLLAAITGYEPLEWSKDYRAKNYRDSVKNMEKTLGGIGNQSHADLAWCKGALAEASKRLEDVIAKGTKEAADKAASAAAEAKDVDGRVAELKGFFDAANFHCDLAPPFTQARVTAWIADLRKWKLMGEKGLAEVAKIVEDHPTYEKDPRIAWLKSWFSKGLGERIEDGIAKTMDWWPRGGTSRQESELLHRIAKVDYALDKITDARLADDKWVKEYTQDLRDSIEAHEAKLLFWKEYYGKEDAETATHLAKVKTVASKIEGDAKRVLEAQRMPPARSTDAGDLEIAKETLKNEDYGVGKYERIVINSAKEHHVEKMSDSRVEGDYIVIRTWTEEWDDFQVALAEKVGEEYRIVYYTLKHLDRGAPWSIVGRWYCKERIVSSRILEENIQK